MAFQLLPIYYVLPNVIVHEVISILTPQDRIELSHSCQYFRTLIISPRCLSDLWLYIYHIPITKQPPTSKQSSKSTFLPHMLFNSSTPQNNTNNHTSNPSPSHATSLPNTLATSTAMSSRPLSAKSLFKASSSSSSESSTPSKKDNGNRNKIDEESLTLNNSPKITGIDEEKENYKYSQIPRKSSSSSASLNLSSILETDRGNISDSTISSTDPLLEHPSNPVLTSKIIYWPNYKQVLACDFPIHWRRKNSFYQNLCVLSKNCGGCHVRVFEVGKDRLNQILSRISPMLLSLCFLNVRSIRLDSYAFS